MGQGQGTVHLLDPVETQFVDHQKCRAGVPSKSALQGIIGQGGVQVRKHLGGGGVPNRQPSLAGLGGQGHGDVALPCAAVPCQNDPLPPVDELGGGQFPNELLIETRLESKIEILERFGLGQGGLLEASPDTAFRQRGHLIGKQTKEEAQGGLLAGGEVDDGLLDGIVDGVEFEGPEVLLKLGQFRDSLVIGWG